MHMHMPMRAGMQACGHAGIPPPLVCMHACPVIMAGEPPLVYAVGMPRPLRSSAPPYDDSFDETHGVSHSGGSIPPSITSGITSGITCTNLSGAWRAASPALAERYTWSRAHACTRMHTHAHACTRRHAQAHTGTRRHMHAHACTRTGTRVRGWWRVRCMTRCPTASSDCAA